ncbi:MAG: VCBS repeat-containing protein, partial [Candidatus Brocadiae bacterium]|nr:VCBS repeat-containing protein [Candidatus Brocadiia bacterium]
QDGAGQIVEVNFYRSDDGQFDGLAANLYEPNDSDAQAADLGATRGWQGWYELAIAPAGDEDWFEIDLVAQGSATDFVRIEFAHAAGNLQLELYDAGQPVDLTNPYASSTSSTDDEEISLDGVPVGTYYVRAYGAAGATNDSYDLVIRTPSPGPAVSQANLYFRDEDGDGLYDPVTEDLWADVGGTPGVYDHGVDQRLSDQAAWETAGGASGAHGNVYFYDTDVNGAWDLGELAWAEQGGTALVYDEFVDARLDATVGDVLLGTGTQVGVTDDWAWSAPATWAPDTYYYFATATDDGEGAAGIQDGILFDDTGGTVSEWDLDEEIWDDVDGDDLYSDGTDTQIYDGGDGFWDTLDGQAGIHGNLLLQDVNGDGGWDLGEAIWAEGVADGVYAASDDTLVVGTPVETSATAMTIGKVNDRPVVVSLTGSPDPISRGDMLTLVASGVSDSDGVVDYVTFYHDADGDGIWTGSDHWLGVDTNGSNGWEWQGLVQWDSGDYFAVATDNDEAPGAWPDDIAVGHVNQKPIIDAVTNNPNPIVEDAYVTFLADNVRDPDTVTPTQLYGDVGTVAFYRDVFHSGHYNPVEDELLGYGSNIGGGQWRLIVLADWDPDISPMYFAVAQDVEGDWGDAVWTLNQNPTLDEVVGTPDPVTLDDELLLEALGVGDSDGFLTEVLFTVFDPPTGLPPYGWPNSTTTQYGWPTDWQFDTNGSDGYTWQEHPRWTISGTVMDDFNQDGHMDVAVSVDVSANIGPDFVSVILNDGFGSFYADSLVLLGTPPSEMSPFHQYNPSDIDSSDFNGDGYPDLVTANSATDRISVMLNNGDGTFTAETYYEVDFSGSSAEIYPHALTVADLNDDGITDVAVASFIDHAMSGAGNVYPSDNAWHGTVSVLFGDGTGQFAVDRAYSLAGPGLTPEDLVAADLDQDGFTDLAVVSQDGVLFMWNNGNFMETEGLPGFFGDAGGVIGRAMETGITGAETQQVVYDYVWRNGWVEGTHATAVAPYYHEELTGQDYDMYRVTLEEGALLEVTVNPVPYTDDTDPLATDFTIWNSNGAWVFFVDDGIAGALVTFQFVAPATGNYYVGIGGYDPAADDPYNAITGEDPFAVDAEGEYEITFLAYGGTYDLGPDNHITVVVVGDIYEPNDSDLLATDLGTALAWRGWYDLALPQADEDWFEFDLLAGGVNDFVRIEFVDASGNLDLELYDSTVALVASSTSTSDNEQISLDTLAAGTYYARVYGGPNPSYDLILHGSLPGIQGNLLLDDDWVVDGLWQPNEAVFADLNANATYDALLPDTIVYASGTLVDQDAGVPANLYFNDLNANGTWDAEEDVWGDVNANGIYEEGIDSRIYSGARWETPAPTTQGNLLFRDFVVANGVWDAGEDAWADMLANGVYDDGIDIKVYNPFGWTTLTGQPGIAGDLWFYDINDNGLWDIPNPATNYYPGEFVFADTDADQVYTEGVDSQVDATPELLGIPDGTFGIHGDVLFYDVNENGFWDPNEDLWADSSFLGRPGVYDTAWDTQIHDVLAWDVPDGAVGIAGRVFFVDANGNGRWSVGEGVWADHRGVSPDVPVGAGDSIVAANFLEDNWDPDSFNKTNYDRNLPDIDVATANSQTNRVSVLLGNHMTWPSNQGGRVESFLGLYPNEARSAMAGVDRGVYDHWTDFRIEDADREYQLGGPGYDNLANWNVWDGATGTQGDVYFLDINRGWNTYDGQAGIRGNIWFYDADSNGQWTEGEPVWAEGERGLSGWDDTDIRIYGQTDWIHPMSRSQANLRFSDANDNGVWDPGENVWAEDASGTADHYDEGIDIQI